MAKKENEKAVNSVNSNDKKKILFVCLGNICRSPAAEGVLRDIVRQRGREDEFTIDSAATSRYNLGRQPDSRMVRAARRRGLELNHICRHVEADDFRRFDMIVAMDENNYRDLCRVAPDPESEKKIVRMSSFLSPEVRVHHDFIPDPYYEGAEGFELVLDLLEDACTNIADQY